MKNPVFDLIPRELVDLKEKILVIESSFVSNEEGVLPMVEEEIYELISNHGSYQIRDSELEIDTNFKQIIPYIVVKSGNEYLFATRTIGGGESRLHDKGLIGFGGHVRAEDVEDKGMLEWGKREIKEELDIRSPIKNISYVGVINNFKDPVSLVHLGILILVEVVGKDVSIKESDKFSLPEWLGFEELKKIENLEGWSRLVAESGLV